MESKVCVICNTKKGTNKENVNSVILKEVYDVIVRIKIIIKSTKTLSCKK